MCYITAKYTTAYAPLSHPIYEGPTIQQPPMRRNSVGPWSV